MRLQLEGPERRGTVRGGVEMHMENINWPVFLFGWTQGYVIRMVGYKSEFGTLQYKTKYRYFECDRQVLGSISWKGWLRLQEAPEGPPQSWPGLRPSLCISVGQCKGRNE